LQLILRTTRRLIVGATLLYCIALIVLLLIWGSGTQGSWVELSRIFALYLFTPLLLLVPAAILIRSRELRAGAAIALVIFLSLFGTRLIPPLGAQPGGPTLRVMTFNLGNLKSSARVASIIAAIRSQRADLVGLQELSNATMQTFQKQLSQEYPYQVYDRSRSHEGVGLLSRYPLHAIEWNHRLPGQQVVADINGAQVTAINISMSSPKFTEEDAAFNGLAHIQQYDPEQRSRDTAAVLEAIDQVNGPLVLLGDFNTSDREQGYGQFAAKLHDAYGERGWGFGFTYPNNRKLRGIHIPFPLIRIDYVWSKGGVLPLAGQVRCTDVSDHCAVTADLWLDHSDERVAVSQSGLDPADARPPASR
jgi:endonuclease/exonuclease/phosphatase (EEP) superfamily protein YafD